MAKPPRKRKKRATNPRHNTREPTSPWPRILIFIPQERSCPGGSFYDFLAIASQGHPILELGYSRTMVVRNKAATHFLQTRATHLLMLDIDHKHPRDIVQRLVRWVIQDPTKLVVGGMNFRRGAPYEPCAFIYDESGNAFAPAEWPRGLIKVDILGTGSILIAREVFETIQPPWFYDLYDSVWQDIWPGEDAGFARECHKHGIDQWMDTTTTSPHLIDGVVDESVFRAYLDDHPEKVDSHPKVMKVGGLVKPQEDEQPELEEVA